MKKVITSNIEKTSDGIRVTKTIEQDEVLSIEQIHGRLKAEEKNLEMYEKLAAEKREKIAQYRQALADYYSSSSD